MHLHRLKLPRFRNLQDFEIRFTDKVDDSAASGGQRRFNSHAVIGQNGAGKSNLIEALITIFRDLDLGNAATLDYELNDESRGQQIAIKAVNGKRPTVSVDGARASASRLSEEARELLPSNVFVYYSGRNERIEQLFRAHQERFNRRQEITADEYLPEHLLQGFKDVDAQAEALTTHRRREDRRRAQLGEDQLRRLFYCRGGHSQLVLLACLLAQDETFTALLNQLGIVALDSALFVLKQPHRLREKLAEQDILEGDNRFWYARGNVVSEFLDKLWQLAVAPIDDEVRKQIDFRGRSERQKQVYLFLSSQEKLRELGDAVGQSNFFRYAEGAYIGDLIDEVRITVKHRDADGTISFDQLSEGEMQLLTVLGLMRITAHDHCLFLLDEPDTHLNPIWKLRYFDEIEKMARRDESQTLAGDSQIIVTTHDPMMIGGLRREQVRILRKDDGHSVVDTPIEHPQGMGVAGLLKSEMFGLPSTLDKPTLDKLQRRNDLLALKAHSDLSAEQTTELDALRAYLDDLGFSREYRDPMYQLFIQEMVKVRSQPLNMLMTPQELETQEALAREVVTKLVKHQRTDDLSALAQELKKLVD
jgi:predicted ATPase